MELQAPSQWRCADFISDLHLQAAERATFAAWAGYMQTTQADAVFILGDLFEVWVGDDAALAAGSFEAECVAVLRAAGQRLALFIMPGNRDFLMGPGLMRSCAATALPDPTLLCFSGERILLSHGDALCVDDLEYQNFRRQVRSSSWQQQFLARPLEERQAIARGIRQQSTSRKQGSAQYADVDTSAALALMAQHQTSRLIHGHTHQPAEHALAPGLVRTVLSDWDVAAMPPRSQVLRLRASGPAQVTQQRLSLQATASFAD